jgi:formylglycine-generating enzyme required for sulfatase activity
LAAALELQTLNCDHRVEEVIVQQRWFLSYHSPDQALAERVKAAIERKDPTCRVFFAPTHLRAGGFWTAQLAQEIDDATAFILLVGERGLGSWQLPEYDEALDRRVKSPDFPVVLMLLAGQTAPGLPFLRQLHWIVTPDPASDKDVARLLDAVSGSSTRPGELWRYTSPYRGLTAMEERDSDYFFGRERETIAALKALVAAPDTLPVLLGNSGVGKSSVAQAGVLAALRRQAWPESPGNDRAWPAVFQDSRRWCFITLRPGTEPLRELVEPFLQTWQYATTDPAWEDRRSGWIDRLLGGKATLRGLLDATERRYVELGQPKPPAFFLYVDQGEELYVRAGEHHRRRFSELLAHGLGDPRFHALMSMRTDFFGDLQKDEPLYQAHRLISIAPLREAQLHKVVNRPAELLSARFETDRLATVVARRTAEESTKDAGALPLLSYMLDDMWSQMIRRGDGVLRLPEEAFELGGVLVERANAFISRHPGSENQLRRIFTLKLATVREDGEPTRRRAWRSEFSDAEWRLVSDLADHPNRLLITAILEAGATLPVPQSADTQARGAAAAGQTYAEVAHEAIFRRWGSLREWIAAEREFLAWRSGLEGARRAWQEAPDASKTEALLMGFALARAQSWLAKRGEDLPGVDREFIDLSVKRERKARGRARRVQALVYVLLVGIIAGLVAWNNQSYLRERWKWYTVTLPYKVAQVRPHVLTAEAERALVAGASFRECAKDCPEMVVIPAGEFMMGSPETEKGHNDLEGPQHKVTIARAFAVARFDVTFAEWDACVSFGRCAQVEADVEEEGKKVDKGEGKKPVIYVSWNQAKQYLEWFSKMTDRPYRLLTEAEWQYATRAGTSTPYYWGDEIGTGNANCDGCGSQGDQKEPTPVGSFAPNAFGLYDMVGNVWQWVEDCGHDDYNAAPADGSAWTSEKCNNHVTVGGSYFQQPDELRSANRAFEPPGTRLDGIGFRIARTLSPSSP